MGFRADAITPQGRSRLSRRPPDGTRHGPPSWRAMAASHGTSLSRAPEGGPPDIEQALRACREGAASPQALARTRQSGGDSRWRLKFAHD